MSVIATAPLLAAFADGDDHSRAPVTLKLSNVTAAKALAELRQQSGIPVEDRLGDVRTFDLDITNLTFWPALDAIARAARGRVDIYNRDGKLALVRQSAGYVEPPVSYSGRFRTVAKRVAASRELDSATSTYTATLEVSWEPDLEPLFLQTSPHGLVVRDDRSRKLPTREEGSVLTPVDGRLAKECDVPLPSLPREILKIGLLEGNLSVIAPSKMVDFHFDTLARLADVPAGSPLRREERDGVTCQVVRLQLAPDRWTVQVALDYPTGGVRLESYQSRVANNQLYLEAKDGSKRVAPGGYVIDPTADTRAIISYHFLDVDKALHGKPADWKLHYRTPAKLVEMPFKFSFRDLPLP